jgi:hypothetical protein
MSEDPDVKLGALLREGGVPERDPLFRIRVLERRERRDFQRRAWLLRGMLAVLVVLPAIGFALGSRLLPAGLAVTFGAASIAAGVFSVRGVRLLWSQLRRRH